MNPNHGGWDLRDTGRKLGRRSSRRILRVGLLVAAPVALAWFAYDVGSRQGEARIDALHSRIAGLKAEKRAVGDSLAKTRAALRRAERSAGEWRQRYEDEVPQGRSAALWKLVKRKLDEGVEPARLSGVIGLAANERRCDEPVTRRIIVRTRLHGGSDTAAGFGNGRITVLGDGRPARDARNNPHAWYDPEKPVVIRFVTIGGDTKKVEGYLPLHRSVLVGEDEFRFTVTEGARSFATVAAQRCDYP